MFEAAAKQRSISFEDFLDMCELLADYYIGKGDTETQTENQIKQINS